MENYITASPFPLTDAGGIPIPPVIMGHLPFMGESYQGIKKNQEYLRRFSCVDNIVKVLRRGVEYGMTVMAAMSAIGEQSKRLFKAIKETTRLTGVEIALIPCFRIPLLDAGQPLDDYRRWVTHYSIESKIARETIDKRYLQDPILLCRERWQERFPYALRHLKPYSQREIREIKINYQGLEDATSSLSDFKILLAEPGSESDFLAMTGRIDLLKEFNEWLKDHLECPIFIGTHHAGLTIPSLEESDLDIAGYITPINKLGTMMFPTTGMVLREVRRSEKPIIAIKPLAGGRIPPKEALEYVYTEVKVAACMIGVASESEVDKAFSPVRNIFEVERN